LSGGEGGGAGVAVVGHAAVEMPRKKEVGAFDVFVRQMAAVEAHEVDGSM